MLKKFNKVFIVVLLCVSAGLGSVALFVQWENEELDRTKLAGKAGEFDLGKVEGGDKDSSSEVVVESGNQVLLQGQLAEDKGAGEEISGDVQSSSAEASEDKQSTIDNGSKFSFVAIGDTQSHKEKAGFNPELAVVLEKAKGYNPDFALFTGDIISASGANDEENGQRIGALKDVIEQHFNNYYIAFGGYDVECRDKCVEFWLEKFFDIKPSKDQKKYLQHSFDYLNTHFVLLSTDYPEIKSVDESQLKWLEEDLKKNERTNTVVVQHVSPVSFFKDSAKDCHDMSCNSGVAGQLLKIFKENNVDLVISGGENVFDHKIVDGIHFVLSGKAGNKPRHKNVVKDDIYTLVEIDGEKIELDALNLNGEVIRTILIKEEER